MRSLGKIATPLGQPMKACTGMLALRRIIKEVRTRLLKANNSLYSPRNRLSNLMMSLYKN